MKHAHRVSVHQMASAVDVRAALIYIVLMMIANVADANHAVQEVV
jgi:hypothetical protein